MNQRVTLADTISVRRLCDDPKSESLRLRNKAGREVENGELPDDEGLLGTMIRNICHGNAKAYLALPDMLTARKTSRKATLPNS